MIRVLIGLTLLALLPLVMLHTSPLVFFAALSTLAYTFVVGSPVVIVGYFIMRRVR